MDSSLIQQLGNELYDALRERRTLAPLTDRHPHITIEDAYRISLHMLLQREAAGERVIGKKVGATSKPVQDMLNVRQPDFGFLTDAMDYADGATISIAQAGLIQPRAEGEIAFMLKADLQGPNVTREEALAATEWVAPCFEIVDSRIDDWQIRIQDTVADNASCGVFVVGTQRIEPSGLDLAAVRMRMTRNGEPAGEGVGGCRAGPSSRGGGLAGEHARPVRHSLPRGRADPLRLAGATGARLRGRSFRAGNRRPRAL